MFALHVAFPSSDMYTADFLRPSMNINLRAWVLHGDTKSGAIDLAPHIHTTVSTAEASFDGCEILHNQGSRGPA